MYICVYVCSLWPRLQNGHVECLQWMVEECKVPLEVRDTGGETLVHHAAYYGQVRCWEKWNWVKCDQM